MMDDHTFSLCYDITRAQHAFLCIQMICCQDWSTTVNKKWSGHINKAKEAVMYSMMAPYVVKLSKQLNLIKIDAAGNSYDRTIAELLPHVPQESRMKLLDRCEVIVGATAFAEDLAIIHCLRKEMGLELADLKEPDPLAGLM